MPFLAIAFPVFDPIAIPLGPIAIRWYALAYIGGIVLGWIYARSLVKNERLWGGPAPISLPQLDDFILWVTVGIIVGGRTGYVLFYNPAFFVQHPAEIFQLWNGGMSFHGGFLGCVAAVMWFASRNGISILSLGDITTAVGPIGLFLGRLANFINSELWGRAADPSLPWAMVFPNDRLQLLRHPSQLYQAALEGILLFTVLAVMIRMGALKRPGLILGSFIAIYALARITGELFREPDPQLGFLWGGLTMGMLLSVPMIIAGLILIVLAWRKPPMPEIETRSGNASDRIFAAAERDQEADQVVRPDAGLALHGAVPAASAARLLRLARSARARGRFHHRAGSQPDVRRVARACGRPRCGRRSAQPPLLRLVELGPGRGTMMADALRALRVLPPLYQSLTIHMVEINPVLREKQRATLSGVRNISWHDSIDDIVDGPAVIFANEYFDVLPIHQMVKRETGWHERVVDLDANGKLMFGAAAEPTPRFEVLLPPLVRAAPPGAVFEWRPDTEIMKIATRVRDQDGAALIIDYGHLRSDAGDTFQAIARHSFTDPLKNPGQADVTAHVDFQALVRAAEDLGARVHGPVTQGDFLKRLGIESRAATLMAKTTHEVSADISGALKRLTEPGRGGMGSMFKVLGVSQPDRGLARGPQR